MRLRLRLDRSPIFLIRRYGALLKVALVEPIIPGTSELVVGGQRRNEFSLNEARRGGKEVEKKVRRAVGCLAEGVGESAVFLLLRK